VIDFARKKGCICIKQGGAGSRGSSGWPDYLIIDAVGASCFIEFKRPGGGATELQMQRIRQLESHGVIVRIIDNAEAGRVFIAKWARPV
jgi:hypothetical protein